MENRLAEIKKEILQIREESNAKIALLDQEASLLFDESLTIDELEVGKLFIHDLYYPLCRKVGVPNIIRIEEGQNKNFICKLKTLTRVFPVAE